MKPPLTPEQEYGLALMSRWEIKPRRHWSIEILMGVAGLMGVVAAFTLVLWLFSYSMIGGLGVFTSIVCWFGGQCSGFRTGARLGHRFGTKGVGSITAEEFKQLYQVLEDDEPPVQTPAH